MQRAADEVQRLLGMLPKEEGRSVALLKLEGYTNAEIADRLGCAEGTVERRLNLNRSVWKEAVIRRDLLRDESAVCGFTK
jgi:DNA-directed RNA polymerase specialized sigma24 family protein